MLPIDPLLPEIVEVVRRNPMVLLEAEPGAGKTTRVPDALLRAGLGDVYVLEPRRMAARMAARRVAAERSEEVGESVGYQVRFEQVGSARTRLWYLTEGVLTRRLLSGEKFGKSVVILDEFHERHLETDVALALLRHRQKQDATLKLVLMSATLSGDDLSLRLGDAPLLRAPGRMFPVTVRHTPHSAVALEEQAVQAVEKALQETRGHVLVFLPGAAEIRKTMSRCAFLEKREDLRVLPLHGDLSAEQQDAAVSPAGKRKVICSTNVAESSVTIEGVSAVVDSGVARILTHSPWSGISRLSVEKVSQSSAIQRAGRAGRTGPGLAIRLYPESDFVRRPAQLAPEILRTDLTQFTLQLAVHGLRWRDIEWLDEPPPALRDQAKELLQQLGLLHADETPTHSGRTLGALPIHPRLAVLAYEAAQRGAGRAGAEVAARLSEGRIRLEQDARGNHLSDIDALLATELHFETRRLLDQVLRRMPQGPAHAEPQALDKSIAAAFPDRIARKRGELLLLANGRSARLDQGSAVRSEFLVALEVDDRGDQNTVRLASPLEPDWLLDLFPAQIALREEMVWNREAERVEQLNSISYRALTIDETRGAPLDRSQAAALLATKAREAGVAKFVQADLLEALLNRIRFARQHGVEVPEEDELLEGALRQLADGLTSFKELQSTGRGNTLLGLLEAALPMRRMDEVAPSHVSLPNGRRAKIEYRPGQPPSVASRLQDFFGMLESPRVGRGTVPLVMELLAPNKRPIQVTTDLASFWRGLYPQVRKELSRRYPKHEWPEKPY